MRACLERGIGLEDAGPDELAAAGLDGIDPPDLSAEASVEAKAAPGGTARAPVLDELDAAAGAGGLVVSAAAAAPRARARAGRRRSTRPSSPAPSREVAPDLVGCSLLVDGVGGVIVEVERYQQDDPASHSFRGPCGRAAVMFGAPGPPLRLPQLRAALVRSTWSASPRAAGRPCSCGRCAPTHGLDVDARPPRAAVADRLLCAGPGRLCAALGVDGRLDGAAGGRARGGGRGCGARTGPVEIVTGPRIGITKAADRPWRFGLAGSPLPVAPLPAARERDAERLAARAVDVVPPGGLEEQAARWAGRCG